MNEYVLIGFMEDCRNLDMYMNDEDLPEEKKSPRAMYLRRVTKENLTPMPLLLRKETVHFLSLFPLVLHTVSKHRTRREYF